MEKVQCHSILRKLSSWKEAHPSKTVFSFMDLHGKVTKSLTYEELDNQTSTLANLLLSKNEGKNGVSITPGDKVLLVYLPCLDFIISFLACLRAGIVAVPVYPPDPCRLKRDVIMFNAVVLNCGAKVALTSTTYKHIKTISAIKEKFSFSERTSWPDLEWIETDSMLQMTKIKTAVLGAYDKMENVAFLQYTSGSTSTPKGVMITHRNLYHNLETICENLEANTETVVVSWLPQYHDMGLIGAYLGVIFCGGSGFYMSPISFVQNPSLWLETISKYRGTHLQAPNFGYILCAKKQKFTDDCSIDLSCIKHMINGAEPVTAEAIDSFQEAFAKYGLPPKVVFPTYGLAEHTVFVCGNGSLRLIVDKNTLEEKGLVKVRNSTDDTTKELIGCGKVRKSGIDVLIVNPQDNTKVEDGTVGEIWIDSPSKAKGYYGLEELTDSQFFARVHGSTVQYLRTGDLGFIYENELFICGRMKDLIVIRGRNHYPQDIERSVESISAIRPGCSVAFSYSSPTTKERESVVIAAELRVENKSEAKRVVELIQSRITFDHGINASAIVLLNPRTIPKTTSGKICRQKCKQYYYEKRLDEVFRQEEWSNIDKTNVLAEEKDPECQIDHTPALHTSTEEATARLRQEISQLLEIPLASVGSNIALQKLGMDSMAITQLRGIISNQYNFEIDEEILYHQSTCLNDIVQCIVHRAEEDTLEGEGDQVRSFLKQAENHTETQKSRTSLSYLSCCCKR